MACKKKIIKERLDAVNKSLQKNIQKSFDMQDEHGFTCNDYIALGKVFLKSKCDELGIDGFDIKDGEISKSEIAKSLIESEKLKSGEKYERTGKTFRIVKK